MPHPVAVKEAKSSPLHYCFDSWNKVLCWYPVSGFCHSALLLDIFNLDSFVQKTLSHLVQAFSNFTTWILMFNVAKWTL